MPWYSPQPLWHCILQLSINNNARAQWKGRSYLWRFRDWKLHRSVTSHPYVLRELSCNTTMWRLCREEGKPATALCLPSANQRRSMQGREENRTGQWRGKGSKTATRMHQSFKRRAKHAEVKLHSQTENGRSALSPLLCCHSFPTFAFFKSLSQEAFPFPHTIQNKF